MAIAAETQFHVLAVDDSLIDRKLIERLLKTSSYHVTTVDSGSKALEFLGLLQDEQANSPASSSSSSSAEQNVSFLFINIWNLLFIKTERSKVFLRQKKELLSVCLLPSPLLFFLSRERRKKEKGRRQRERRKGGSAYGDSRTSEEIEVNLVITDYCMPGMTGYDLLKRIKESQSLKDIPVVIMSSENVPSRINRCLEEGAEEFLLKPVKLSDMNKLRPHILKGKNKDQQHLQQEHQQSEQQTEQVNNISSSSSSSNKRKAVDGGLSPERTRPRLSSNNSLTVL